MRRVTLKRSLVNYFGLLGVVSLLSYTAAVVFSPMAYPGYDWMSQAVSDLSAANAPSLKLWNQLSSLYGICGIISIMMLCVVIQGKLTKLIRLGIYAFAIMNWISYVGYSMFPLTESGYAGSFQDIMHMVVTILVVVLSILALLLIIIGGFKKKSYLSYAVWALIAFFLMMTGAIMSGTVPKEYFGIFERFSVFSATGFNAVLGIYLFNGKDINR